MKDLFFVTQQLADKLTDEDYSFVELSNEILEMLIVKENMQATQDKLLLSTKFFWAGSYTLDVNVIKYLQLLGFNMLDTSGDEGTSYMLRVDEKQKTILLYPVTEQEVKLACKVDQPETLNPVNSQLVPMKPADQVEQPQPAFSSQNPPKAPHDSLEYEAYEEDENCSNESDDETDSLSKRPDNDSSVDKNSLNQNLSKQKNSISTNKSDKDTTQQHRDSKFSEVSNISDSESSESDEYTVASSPQPASSTPQALESAVPAQSVHVSLAQSNSEQDGNNDDEAGSLQQSPPATPINAIEESATSQAPFQDTSNISVLTVASSPQPASSTPQALESAVPAQSIHVSLAQSNSEEDGNNDDEAGSLQQSPPATSISAIEESATSQAPSKDIVNISLLDDLLQKDNAGIKPASLNTAKQLYLKNLMTYFLNMDQDEAQKSQQAYNLVQYVLEKVNTSLEYNNESLYPTHFLTKPRYSLKSISLTTNSFIAFLQFMDAHFDNVHSLTAPFWAKHEKEIGAYNKAKNVFTTLLSSITTTKLSGKMVNLGPHLAYFQPAEEKQKPTYVTSQQQKTSPLKTYSDLEQAFRFNLYSWDKAEYVQRFKHYFNPEHHKPEKFEELKAEMVAFIKGLVANQPITSGSNEITNFSRAARYPLFMNQKDLTKSYQAILTYAAIHPQFRDISVTKTDDTECTLQAYIQGIIDFEMERDIQNGGSPKFFSKADTKYTAKEEAQKVNIENRKVTFSIN